MNGKYNEDSIAVFVRVRPLTHDEIKAKETVLPGLTLTTTVPSSPPVAYSFKNTTLSSFSRVFGQDTSNVDLFESAFLSRISTVASGGSASLFSYGATSSGKSHTILGYEEEGLYFLSAKELLNRLHAEYGFDQEEDFIYLLASACEIYNNSIYDLLDDEKEECTLKIDSNGQMNIRRSQHSESLDVICGLEIDNSTNNAHSTLVTQADGLNSVRIRSPEDLITIHNFLNNRVVGSSTAHSQSSRSHVLLFLEIVNDSIVKAKNDLDSAKAVLPAIKNALDNVTTKRVCECIAEYYGILQSGNSKWRVTGGNPSTGVYELEGYSERKPLEYWKKELKATELKFEVVSVVKEDSESKNKYSVYKEQEKTLTEAVNKAEQEIERAEHNLLAIYDGGPSCLRGSLVLVDLAGADYDHRVGKTAAERKEIEESIAINKSLFSLKECLRSMSLNCKKRPVFRNSKLTRILEDTLSPNAASKRRNRKSVSVMILNVCPASSLEKLTLNSLRYGQLFSST